MDLDAAPATARRFDLDWLRVFAFAMLIFYHVGAFYETWAWPVLEAALGLMRPWRLALLFLISGVAVRFAIDKAPLRRFLKDRTVRLAVPLVFGTLVICAPQTYVALRYWDQIPPGYLAFYRDYLGFGAYAFALPDMHHLWYVAYILAYTLIAAACLPLLRWATRAIGGPLFGWFAGGPAWRILLVPALPFAAYTVTMEIYYPFEYMFTGDWLNIVRTLTFFLIGFLAAKNEDFWNGVDRALPSSIGLSLVLGGLLLAALLNQFAVGADTKLLYPALVLRAFYGWSVIVMLLGLARSFANRPSRALTYLTAAVFPYYILHQTIITVAGYWFILHPAPWFVAAGAVIAATVLGCAAGFEVIRRAGPARLLFGLPLREKAAPQPPLEAVA